MKKTAVIGAAAAALLALAAAPGVVSAHEHAAHTASVTPVAITAPAATYTLDKTHASLTFQVMHLGLSHYTARFTDFDATLQFDPANPTASSVTATINPASIETDYPGDYRGTHQNSAYQSWNEDLAQNPRWFNASAFPQISFQSTGVTLTGERTGVMTGNLTFLGQTHPVTLDVTFNGELSPHPFLNGRSAIGFSARGALDRTQWGMTALAPRIGEQVNLIIEAEFHQAPTE